MCSLAPSLSHVVQAIFVLINLVFFHAERNWHLTVPGFSKEDKNPQRNYVRWRVFCHYFCFIWNCRNTVIPLSSVHIHLCYELFPPHSTGCGIILTISVNLKFYAKILNSHLRCTFLKWILPWSLLLNRFYLHLHCCYQHAHQTVDWILELWQVKAVVDPQQPEFEAAGVRSASNKLTANNSIVNHQTRGPVGEPSSTPTVGPVSKIPRF